jgi:hypothetical protein
MREMFVQLQRGVYHSARPLTDLHALFNRFNERATLQLEACPRWLHVDGNILLLCLEEGFSNAAKYGDPSRPFVVMGKLTLEPVASIKQRLRKGLHNTPPGRVARGREAWLHVALDTVNAPGLDVLTDEMCEACMAEGVKGQALSRSAGAYISDGLGLDCVRRATVATGGGAFLSTRKDPEGNFHTVLHCLLPCEISSPHPTAGLRSGSFGVSFGVRDALSSSFHSSSDPESSRENSFENLALNRAASAAGFELSREHSLASSYGELPAAMVAAHASGSQSANASVRGPSARVENGESLLAPAGRRSSSASPLCYAIDDSALMQQMLQFVFTKLSAHPSSRVFGSEPTHCSDLLMSAVKPGCHADLVILDENIEVSQSGVNSPRSQTVKGSKLALQLRQMGFKGLLCMYSGESLVNLRKLDAYGAFDLVITKGNSPQAMVDVLQHKLAQMRSTSVLGRSELKSGLKAWSADSRRASKSSGKVKEVATSPLAARRARAGTSPSSPRPTPSSEAHGYGKSSSAQATDAARDEGGQPDAGDKTQGASVEEDSAKSSRSSEPVGQCDSAPEEILEKLPDKEAGSATTPAEDDEAKETDELGRQLLDLSALEGIPTESVKMLLSMYFTPGSKVDAHAQLMGIRAIVTSGEVDELTLRKSLHQLSGSSLQAGAFAFGTRVKEYKFTRDGVAGVDALEALLARSAEAARRRGVL